MATLLIQPPHFWDRFSARRKAFYLRPSSLIWPPHLHVYGQILLAQWWPNGGCSDGSPLYFIVFKQVPALKLTL